MTRHTMGSWSLTDDDLDLDLDLSLGLECGVGASRAGADREPTAEVAQALRVHIEAGWRHFAACAGTDPDTWFKPEPESEPDAGCEVESEEERPAQTEVAADLLAVCAGCPVRPSCLATALLHDETGVWAGTTPAARDEAAAMLAAGNPAVRVLDELLTRVSDKAPTVHRSPADAARQPGRAA